MYTIERLATATIPTRTADWEMTNAATDGTNAVARLPKPTSTKAKRRGLRLPFRSAAMAKRIPRSEAARTIANIRLI